MTDPISDMFIRIKNAQRAKHESVLVPYSKFKYAIVEAMEREGLIVSAERKGKKVKKFIEIMLAKGERAPQNVKLISKSSRRIYASYKELGRPKHGGVLIISTPKGVMSLREAKKAKVGGEIIAEIW